VFDSLFADIALVQVCLTYTLLPPPSPKLFDLHRL